MSIAGLLAASAVAMLASLIFSGSAPAMTVYDYVYSGEYIDGTGSDKGTFGAGLAGIGYDEGDDRLLVAVGSSPAYVTRFTPAGTPDPFSGLGPGVDTIVTGAAGDGGTAIGFISVDNTAAPSAGNIYLSSNGLGEFWMRGFHADGTPLAGFAQFNEGICGIVAGDGGEVWTSSGFGLENGLERFDTAGNLLGRLTPLSEAPDPFIVLSPQFMTQVPCRPARDSQGNLYATRGTFDGRPVKIERLDATTYVERYQLSQSNSVSAFAVDKSADEVFALEGNTVSQYDRDGRKLESFGPEEPGYSGLSGTPQGIAVDSATHTVWVANGRDYAGVRRVEKFIRSAPIVVPSPTTVGVDSTPTSATLEGTVDPDGIETTDCHFEWGTTQALGSTVPCTQGNAINGTGPVPVSAGITDLVKGETYWFRLFAKNANGRVVDGGPKRFMAQGEPVISTTFADRVTTEGARLDATIDPNGGRTRYTFEYGPTASYGQTTPVARVIEVSRVLEFSGPIEREKLPESILEPRLVRQSIAGLVPGQQVHYRVVATNEQGTTAGPDQVFTTYLPDPGTDPCPNAHVRQQVEASLLADCRAYELVSPANAGGYDVESDLVAGQTPLVSSPYARDRALFSIHDGLVPGAEGSPTNFDRDPYVARRDPVSGWATSYVGLPADGMAQSGAFGSPLLGNDAALETFAFGGESICDPCFPDGSTNVPLRLPDGQIVKGMAGALNPAADPTQTVLDPLSDDGSHFVFGSDAKFEALGDPGGSIYDRNLETGQTQVISNGIVGGELGELDISPDGLHIVIGKRLSTDAAGNDLWHPYMHVGTTATPVDLAPGASAGVLYDGMSADGSRAFMSTADQLLPGVDTDLSIDIYEASVSGSGPAVLRLVTTKAGSPSNDDTCSPPGIPDSWNSPAGAGKCDAVAPAGGAGVAPATGTFFFFSPERLDGSQGIQDQANLYVVKPEGNPEFVATVDSSLGKPGPPPANHPVVTAGLVTGLTTPEGIAVDQSNGDIYVVEREAGRLARYTSAGAAHNFTAGPGVGTNKISQLGLGGLGEVEIAVDNAAGSPFNGSFYTRSGAGGVAVYASSGEKLGTISGGFSEVCGVAVDQSSGAVYVGDYGGYVWRFAPVSTTPPVTSANYTKTGLGTSGMSPCNVAADKVGHVYASAYNSGPVKVFSASDFAAIPPSKSGTTINATSNAVMTDPATDDLYIDEGNQIKRFDSAGNFIQAFGSGSIGTTSRGVAIRASNGHVYAASSGNAIVEFGSEPVPYIPIDNPAVSHGVQQAATHSYGDFQVSSSGEFAVVSSVLPLTGYPVAGRSEIYRYDSGADELACVSCPVTNSPATRDATLSAHGANLIDDGRVFFTTGESLVLRDTNEKKDAYEWTDGSVQLISTGSSPEDSGLLTASADGRDVFFFTYDTLVSEDENGSTIKIYTAREGGGFPYDPPLHPCAASDECHGPGTRAPDPPQINTIEGAGRRPAPGIVRCRKGFVKKRGKCVKKNRKRRHRKSIRKGG